MRNRAKDDLGKLQEKVDENGNSSKLLIKVQDKTTEQIIIPDENSTKANKKRNSKKT